MLLVTVLLCLILLALLATLYLLMALPDFRSRAGRPVKVALYFTMALTVVSILVNIAVKVQERTGISMGISGGLSSDARQWISHNSPGEPTINQPGDNIRILREGLAFLRKDPDLMKDPAVQSVISQYSGLPATPTRLLSREEERNYYDGALAVRQIIAGLANEKNTAEAQPAY